ncbi:MAG TPA: NAD(P)H-hydrate dehydratase [Vitreimonas sp.]|nr:NAD(P)H-hydrate dehydratase [Vitreimonas sp.]
MNNVTHYLQQLTVPDPSSHKGQNGKLLLIGGSELFHAASRWSLEVASKCVDMVFYASVPSNNDLIREAKANFWNGIVIEREEIEAYLTEADCVLIGPGMTRTADTTEITNHLLQTYPHKKWVIDAGALQMADPHLFNEQMIITPHTEEFVRVMTHLDPSYQSKTEVTIADIQVASRQLNNATLLHKRKIDVVANATEGVMVEGGNAGMTKGGTGDVLAGLVAALYCTHDAMTAAVVGSYINKKAGDALYKKVGPYFNATDLVAEIPQTLWSELNSLP